MDEMEARVLGIQLMEMAPMAYLTTIDPLGWPQTRAMLNLRNRDQFHGLGGYFKNHKDDLLVLFGTNTSSNKVAHIRNNPRVSVYYCKPLDFRGLMLGGKAEIVTEGPIKEEIWQEGWTYYYPEGVKDSDYTVIALHPEMGRYYHRLDTCEFRLREHGEA
jgi:general stress protein 26